MVNAANLDQVAEAGLTQVCLFVLELFVVFFFSCYLFQIFASFSFCFYFI